MSQGFRALSAVLLLVTIALVSALITMRLAIHGAEVQVPMLRGRTVQQAFVELRAKGLQVDVEGHYYSATRPVGTILTQSPAPGTLVRKSWRVRVSVSLGPQKVAAPSVDGMNETIATITIRRTGLQLGAVVGLPYAYAPENTVIAQTPTGHATDIEGPRVSILTALPAPPPDNASVMPDMIGENFTEAALAIIHAGFKLAPLQTAPVESSPSTPTSQLPSSEPTSPPISPAPATPAISAPSGSVVAQVPAAGTRVPAGSMIQVTVQP